MFNKGKSVQTSLAAAFMLVSVQMAKSAEDFDDRQPRPTQMGSKLILGQSTPVYASYYYDFCPAHKDECALQTDKPVIIKMTARNWDKIRAVNTSVNKKIIQATDLQIYGVEEKWTYPDNNIGDCEDIALLKRRTLEQKGFDPSSLLLMGVRRSNGEGHLVLVVRTTAGDYVLDNLTTAIKPVNDTGYFLIKAMDPSDFSKFRTVVDTTAPPNAVTALTQQGKADHTAASRNRFLALQK